MPKKLIIFVALLIALLVFQAKVIMPSVYEIIASDFFLEDSGDEKSRVSSTNLLTDSAYKQCNAYVEEALDSQSPILFSDQPINAFSLGNFKYVINADFKVTPADGTASTRRYVCRIQYLEGSDHSDLSNTENWSIEGISGIDNL